MPKTKKKSEVVSELIDKFRNKALCDHTQHKTGKYFDELKSYLTKEEANELREYWWDCNSYKSENVDYWYGVFAKYCEEFKENYK